MDLRSTRGSSPPNCGRTANSSAFDSDVVWFEVLRGARFQAWNGTTLPASGRWAGFVVQSCARSCAKPASQDPVPLPQGFA
jgi:hypothetical protein